MGALTRLMGAPDIPSRDSKGDDSGKKSREGILSRLQKQRSSNQSGTSTAANKGYGGGSAAEPSTYKRGGKVRKGGMARVHKGERVLTRKQARRYKRSKGR